MLGLEMGPATPAEAARIAEVHMAAFGDNALLRAQFPTPAVREALQKCIELKALADIQDPKTTVLVVRDPKAGSIVIAFAKWSHPVEEGEDYTEPPWIWPEGTDLDVLGKWTAEVEMALQKVLGTAPCYRKLDFPFVFSKLSYDKGICVPW